ncbi:helix-turn-helix domain-containing protein [Bacteroides pyogenes]|uniref:helix-turn-helix domain-containing protein n=1 Tax=Bacteroides pyogenes TaxID=310300 RepID=UPI002FD91E09
MKKQIVTVTSAPKRWLTNQEAEKYLGCKQTFLKNLRLTGQLHFYKVGGLILYDVADLDKLVIKNKVV